MVNEEAIIKFNSNKMDLSDILKSHDRLGHPFSLNFKGSSAYKTWLGATVSMFINILIMVILSEKLVDLFIMRDPSV